MFSHQNIDLFRIRLILAVAILSSAIVSYEIQLIHFFTIIQWHHFAFMVISIALLGFGASGTLISIFRTWLLKREESLLPFLMVCSGLLMSLVIRLSRSEIFLFDSYTLFVDHSQFWRLLATYILCFLPFFSGALAIGMIFVSKVSRIGTYYFADLAGAGLGAVIIIILFWRFSPQEIPSIIALLPILAGIIIIGKKTRIALFTFTVLSLGMVIYHFNRPFNLAPSQFKGISYALNLPDATITHEQSSPYGLLQVVSSPVLRYAPGLSLTYSEKVNSSAIIFNNGDWYAAIPQWSKKDSMHLLDYTTMALPYALGHQKKVLLLNAGAGLDISYALTKGSQYITAVEPNAMVISLLKQDYATATDSLFYHPNVEIYALKSRTFLSQTRDKYDLIQLPLIGAFGGSIGLNALREEHMLTKEAFTEMWHKLDQNGLIAMSSWIDIPPKISLKTTATIAESLEALNIKHPLNHIAAIRSWGTITFVIKRSPLNPTDIENIKSFCERYNFDPVILAGITAEDRVQYNSMEDGNFFNELEGMFTSEREKISDAYDFNIRPATDNKPYFFQFLRWQKLPQLFKTIGQQSTVFTELGYFIVMVTCAQVIILALLFIILPLFRLGWKGRHKSWVLLYFCGLGSGYMFLEIVFIKYFIRYLGHPIYSVAMVISVMLISSGIGSYYSSRLKTDRRTIMIICGIIVSCILAYAMFIGVFLSSTSGLHITIKMMLCGVLIAVPSFFMGMPFPIGLKVVDTIKKSHVPWAWGINGCVSVISTSLAAIMAIELGFMAVLLSAALAYGFAFVSNFLLVQRT